MSKTMNIFVFLIHMLGGLLKKAVSISHLSAAYASVHFLRPFQACHPLFLIFSKSLDGWCYLFVFNLHLENS